MRTAARWAARGLAASGCAVLGGAGVLGALLAGQVRSARGRRFLTETTYERRLHFPGPSTGRPLRMVVMGDSTSTGVGTRRVGQTYAAALARRLARRGPVELLVTGRAGAEAADVVAEQLPLALAARPDLVLVLVGANDVTHLTPTVVYRRNIRTILDALAGTPTVIAGVPELGIVPAISKPLRDLASWRGHRFTAVIRSCARGRSRVRFVNLGRLTGPVFGADPAKAFSSDQFHPSPDGYAFWVAALAPAVEASDPRRPRPGAIRDHHPATHPEPLPAPHPTHHPAPPGEPARRLLRQLRLPSLPGPQPESAS